MSFEPVLADIKEATRFLLFGTGTSVMVLSIELGKTCTLTKSFSNFSDMSIESLATTLALFLGAGTGVSVSSDSLLLKEDPLS